MRNITKFFDNTPFKNETYQFMDIRKTDPYPEDGFYTPYRLLNWVYAKTAGNFESKNATVHDIAHIIDLYERGQQHRLLLSEFGWAIPEAGTKLTHGAQMTELRTATLQSFISDAIFGNSFRSYGKPFMKRDFRKRCAVPFLPTKKEWDAKCAEFFEKHYSLGLDYYAGVWSDACRFVKENRA